MPSVKEWINIKCPACKADQSLYVYKTADVNETPDIRQMLFRGELNIFACVNCKSKLHYDEHMVYSDRAKGLLVNVFSENIKDRQNALRRKIFDELRVLPPEEWMPTYIVFGYGYLAKIIALLEGNPVKTKVAEYEALSDADYYRRLFILSEEWLNARQDPAYASNLEGAEESFSKALCLHQEGDYKKAAGLYQQILDKVPNFYIAGFNLGLLHFNHLNNLEKAGECFEACRRLRPNEGEVIFSLGQIHLRQKHVDKAIDCFRNSIILLPQSSLAWFNLGLGMCMRENVKTGLEILEISLDLTDNADDKKIITRTIEKVTANLRGSKA